MICKMCVRLFKSVKDRISRRNVENINIAKVVWLIILFSVPVFFSVSFNVIFRTIHVEYRVSPQFGGLSTTGTNFLGAYGTLCASLLPERRAEQRNCKPTVYRHTFYSVCTMRMHTHTHMQTEIHNAHVTHMQKPIGNVVRVVAALA